MRTASDTVITIGAVTVVVSLAAYLGACVWLGIMAAMDRSASTDWVAIPMFGMLLGWLLTMVGFWLAAREGKRIR